MAGKWSEGMHTVDSHINDAFQDDSRRSSHCRLCQRCSGGIAHLFGEGAGIFYIYSIAYIDIGLLSIFQYDNPSAILLRDGAEVEIPFSSFIVGDKVIESARMQLQKGDVIIAVSDGVENAGVAHGGASYEGRWGRPI